MKLLFIYLYAILLTQPLRGSLHSAPVMQRKQTIMVDTNERKRKNSRLFSLCSVYK